MSKFKVILVGSCILASSRAAAEFVELKELNAGIREPLRQYAEGHYMEAAGLLEDYSAKHQDQAALLFYYQADAYLQVGNVSKAKELLLKVTSTPFNRQEAYWQLFNLAKQGDDREAVGLLEKELANISERLQRESPPKPEAKEGLFGKKWSYSRGHETEGVHRGHVYKYIGAKGIEEPASAFEKAARAYEYALDVEVPLSERGAPSGRQLIYRWLATAYTNLAASLKAKRVSSGKATEAERLALHYQIKDYIARTRLGIQEREQQPIKGPPDN